MPPMIWVMLDESIPQGTHEFADSVNNGPWGAALTTEFIPHLEQKFRMDAKPTGRLLNGHSSGGWATLQLQINYPKVFGGTWSTSPDPSDFHDFTNVDLYARECQPVSQARRIAGSHHARQRQGGGDHGRTGAPRRGAGALRRADCTRSTGCFRPRARAARRSRCSIVRPGQVHPDVVAYWRDHYDLAHIVESTWAQRGADLKGRIHVMVGTADTFYLDGSAHKFEAVLNAPGRRAALHLSSRSHPLQSVR